MSRLPVTNTLNGLSPAEFAAQRAAKIAEAKKNPAAFARTVAEYNAKQEAAGTGLFMSDDGDITNSKDVSQVGKGATGVVSKSTTGRLPMLTDAEKARGASIEIPDAGAFQGVTFQNRAGQVTQIPNITSPEQFTAELQAAKSLPYRDTPEFKQAIGQNATATPAYEKAFQEAKKEGNETLATAFARGANISRPYAPTPVKPAAPPPSFSPTGAFKDALDTVDTAVGRPPVKIPYARLPEQNAPVATPTWPPAGAPAAPAQASFSPTGAFKDVLGNVGTAVDNYKRLPVSVTQPPAVTTPQEEITPTGPVPAYESPAQQGSDSTAVQNLGSYGFGSSGLNIALREGAKDAAVGLTGLVARNTPVSQGVARLAAAASQVPITQALKNPQAYRNAGAQIVNASAKAMEKTFEGAVKAGARPIARKVTQNVARSAALEGLGVTAGRALGRLNLAGSAAYEGNKLIGKVFSGKDLTDLTVSDAVGYAATGRTPEGVVKDDYTAEDAESVKAADKLRSAQRAKANARPERLPQIESEITARSKALKEALAKRSRLPQ